MRTKQAIPLCLVLLIAGVLITHIAAAQETSTATGFVTITLENVSQLEMGYALPGGCSGFSPDGRLLLTSPQSAYFAFDTHTGEHLYTFSTRPLMLSNSALYDFREDGLYNVDTGERILDVILPQNPPSMSRGYEISPDENLLVVSQDGVYDLEAGVKRFSIEGYWLRFSPDGQNLMVDDDGIYNLGSGERLITVSGTGLFSPDSRYIAVFGDGVYRLETRERLFQISDRASFSPDGNYIRVDGDGVYEVATGERILSISSSVSSIFSPDSRLLAVSEDGVYDLAIRERRFSIPQPEDVPIPTVVEAFSTDSSLLVVLYDGVYDVNTGEHRFRTSTGGRSAFNPDGTLLLVSGDGAYNLATNELVYSGADFPIFNSEGTLFLSATHFSIRNTLTGEAYRPTYGASFYGWTEGFSPDETLLTMTTDYMEDNSNSSCIILGIEGNTWVYRSGYVRTRTGSWLNEVFDRPNGEIVSGIGNEFPILAQTSDEQWYKVGENGWVRASDVEILLMPDGIPVENL